MNLLDFLIGFAIAAALGLLSWAAVDSANFASGCREKGGVPITRERVCLMGTEIKIDG